MSETLYIPIYSYYNNPDIIGIFNNYEEMISETIKYINEDLGKHDDVITNWHDVLNFIYKYDIDRLRSAKLYMVDYSLSNNQLLINNRLLRDWW
jgi:hypothetical protein